MTTNVTSQRCPQCGATMSQVGADGQLALYHCSCCGHNASVTMDGGSNTEYMVKKAELLRRTFVGITDWKTTSWDYLRRDLVDFMSRYEDAQTDLRLNMAILASVTHGFHYITDETYKECKTIYKTTEKLYKIMLRSLKQTPDVNTVEQAEDYKKNRTLYKKCRNDYRNTKLLWKVLFSIGKKLLLK